MRLITCLLLALGTGFAGLGLRAAIPVTPVDDAFRDLLPWYPLRNPAEARTAPQRPSDGPSNMPETSAP